MNNNFFKSLLSSSSGTAATVLFHFASVMLIVKHMPVEAVGVYMLILAIVHGLRVLSGLGLDLTVVKTISAESKPAAQADIFAAALATRLATAVLIGGLVSIFGTLAAPVFSLQATDHLIFISLLCILTSAKELLYHFMQGLHLFKKYAVINTLSALVKFALIGAWMWGAAFGLLQLLLIEVIATAACLAVQLFSLPRAVLTGSPRMQKLKELVTFGFPLYLNNLLTFLYGRANIFIMAILLNPAGIAYFEVARKIPDGLQRLFNSFIVVYFPNLARLISEKRTAEVEKLMNRSLVFLSIGGVFLALLAFLFQNRIISTVFSPDYLHVTTAFVLLIVNLQLKMNGHVMGYSLVSAGYSSLPVKINTFTSVLNILANFALIPQFGFIGAVYASLLTNIVGLLINHRHMHKVGAVIHLAKHFTPLVIFVAIVWLVQTYDLNTLPVKLFALVVYATACTLLYKELRLLFGRFDFSRLRVAFIAIFKSNA